MHNTPHTEATKAKISATKGGWSKHDVATLVNLYPTATTTELMAIFPSRTREAIWNKAHRLGIQLPRGTKLVGRTGENHPTWKGGPKAAAKRGYLRRRAWMGGSGKGTRDGLMRYHVLIRDAGICQLCGLFVEDPGDLSWDHRVALVNGGEHTEENLQIAHFACNCKKGTS